MTPIEEHKIKKLLEQLEQSKLILEQMKVSIDGMQKELEVRLSERFEVIGPRD